MSDHEFEKKVQQKMDELKLRPSEGVWKGVEINLRRDKRRRRTLLWLPVLGILLLTGGYFMFTGKHQPVNTPVAQRQNTPAASAAEQRPSTPEATTGNNRDIAGSDLSGNSAGQNKPLTEGNKSNISTKPGPDTKASGRQPESTKADNRVDTDQGPHIGNGNRRQEIAGNDKGKKNEVGDKPFPRKQAISIINEQTKADENKDGNEKKTDNKTNKKVNNKADNKSDNKTDIRTTDPLQPVQQSNSTVVPQAQHRKAQYGVNAVSADSIRVPEPLSAKDSDTGKNNVVITGRSSTDSAAKSKVSPDSAKQKTPVPPKAKDIVQNKKQPVASKWQWGVMAGAGVTNVSEGSVFNLLNRVRVDDLASAPLFYSGIPPVPDPEPSPIRTGPVFSAGAYVKRNISDRVSISLGLQYSYASVYTKVGSRVDSLATVNFGNNSSRITGQYYRADNELRDYTNRYHFIDMPLELSVRLNRNKRMPISFNGGITLSRLVYTNALHFDGFTKVYYENDDFYNKLQAGFNSSITIGLFQDKKHPISIGPSFRYYLSNLVKDEVTTTEGQHIWSAGLNIKMLLKK